MGVGRLSYITVDTVEPEALAPFWAALLGVEVTDRVEDGGYVLLGPTGEGVPAVAFQRVPEPKVGKARIHVDLGVDDLDEATRTVEALGGAWIEVGVTRNVGDYRWRVMADPEGNEFCIASNAP